MRPHKFVLLHSRMDVLQARDNLVSRSSTSCADDVGIRAGRLKVNSPVTFSPQVRRIARQASGSVSTAGAAVARQMTRLQGRPVSDTASGAAPVTVVEGVAVQIEQGSDGDAPR